MDRVKEPTEPPTSPPPLSSAPPWEQFSPPHLEQAHVYNRHPTPPNTPPPLVHATLRVTAHQFSPPHFEQAHVYNRHSPLSDSPPPLALADQPSLTDGHISTHGQLYHRFDSPPPMLAPIQDERYIRRDDRHSGSHSYLHHPQPTRMPNNDYPGHGGWKPELKLATQEHIDSVIAD